MPARIVVAHSDPDFLNDTVRELQCAGYDVVGFLDSNAALASLESAKRIEVLVTRLIFAKGTPHGVALALMAQLRRPDLKVLFTALPDVAHHAEGLGDILIAPVRANEVLAKIREMLSETQMPDD
jgi:DNA-binding response OmpR family regulator